MSDTSQFHLTAKDFGVLECMLDRLEAQSQGGTLLARLLRRKLSTARIRLGDDIDPRIATINSRVEFRVGGNQSETRVLTHGGENALPGVALPISHPRGLALLGLSAGDTITIEESDGKTSVLHVLRILYQPEAARSSRQRSAFQVISNPRAASARRAPDDEPDNDDPGPFAA